MLTVNEIGSSPAGALHGITSAESSDIRTETGETNLPHAENEPARPLDADAASHLQTDLLTQQRSNGVQRMGRALLRPLIALATAQYVLVTALAVFAALTVASEAGKAVNAKLEPIIAALKRL
ncbi:MAG: hypothetical protein ACRC9K_22555 [Afipia sp.]